MEINRKNLSCDVLIAGGGIGSLVCAVEIKEKCPQLDVLIIEKQTTGYSGKANKGGGVLQYFRLDKIKPMDFLKFHVNEIGSMWSSGRGDGIAAAYRVGAQMRNAEFGNYAQLVRARSHHEVVFGENFMYNAKNEHVTRNFTDKRETDISSAAIREWYLNMTAGTGPIES